MYPPLVVHYEQRDHNILVDIALSCISSACECMQLSKHVTCGVMCACMSSCMHVFMFHVTLRFFSQFELPFSHHQPHAVQLNSAMTFATSLL